MIALVSLLLLQFRHLLLLRRCAWFLSLNVQIYQVEVLWFLLIFVIIFTIIILCLRCSLWHFIGLAFLLGYDLESLLEHLWPFEIWWSQFILRLRSIRERQWLQFGLCHLRCALNCLLILESLHILNLLSLLWRQLFQSNLSRIPSPSILIKHWVHLILMRFLGFVYGFRNELEFLGCFELLCRCCVSWTWKIGISGLWWSRKPGWWSGCLGWHINRCKILNVCNLSWKCQIILFAHSEVLKFILILRMVIIIGKAIFLLHLLFWSTLDHLCFGHIWCLLIRIFRSGSSCAYLCIFHLFSIR